MYTFRKFAPLRIEGDESVDCPWSTLSEHTQNKSEPIELVGESFCSKLFRFSIFFF